MGSSDIPFSRQAIYDRRETCPKCGAHTHTQKIVDIMSPEGLTVACGLGPMNILTVCPKCVSRFLEQKKQLD